MKKQSFKQNSIYENTSLYQNYNDNKTISLNANGLYNDTQIQKDYSNLKKKLCNTKQQCEDTKLSYRSIKNYQNEFSDAYSPNQTFSKLPVSPSCLPSYNSFLPDFHRITYENCKLKYTNAQCTAFPNFSQYVSTFCSSQLLHCNFTERDHKVGVFTQSSNKVRNSFSPEESFKLLVTLNPCNHSKRLALSSSKHFVNESQHYYGYKALLSKKNKTNLYKTSSNRTKKLVQEKSRAFKCNYPGKFYFYLQKIRNKSLTSL